MGDTGTENDIVGRTAARRAGGRAARKAQRLLQRAESSMAGPTRIKSPYSPLSSCEAEGVHRAALEVLEGVGMAAPTDRVLEVALAHGCWQGDGGRLHFPPSLVEDCLSRAANSFPVHGRDRSHDFEAGAGRVSFATGGAAVMMLDRKTRTYRPSTLADLHDLARVAEHLANIQWFTRPVVATDIPDMFELDANTLFACAAGTTKHVGMSFARGSHLARLLPALDALAGGEGAFRRRPFCTAHATTVVSPLNFAEDSLDVACAAVEIGMPLHLQTGPQAGATSPAALAGTLVQGCAESLASLSIINLMSPGHPVVLGNWTFSADLRNGSFAGGGGEAALLGAASGQMSAFYGIPGGMGAGMSDSNLPDNQAGYEKALTMAVAALSGGGFVFESAGMLASLLGCSIEAMIIDDEMLSSIRRIARGISADDLSMSVEVIKRVATGEGHYLADRQTLQLMETEFDYPELANRTSPEEWEASGSLDIWERARIRAEEILRQDHESRIDPVVEHMIRSRYPIHLGGADQR